MNPAKDRISGLEDKIEKPDQNKKEYEKLNTHTPHTPTIQEGWDTMKRLNL